MSDRISTDDPDKDRNIIRDNLMDELCRKQHNFDINGGDQRWRFIEIWETGFPAFENRQYVEEYRNESGYFEIDDNDKVGLTDRGKRYCKERQ